MRRLLRITALTVAALTVAGLAATGVARADTPAPSVATYAVVVGSNAGGPGQLPLRYAEDDARRVGELPGRARRLPRRRRRRRRPPDARTCCARGSISSRGGSHADLAAGKQARVLFYYSGHARATALDLGDAQLPLAELPHRGCSRCPRP